MTSENKVGKVVKLHGDYGFIACDEYPDDDLYFKTAWFRGHPPLLKDDDVSFVVKKYGDNLQAHSVNRIGNEAQSGTTESQSREAKMPGNKRLIDWAYLGYLPTILSELKGMALDEDWEYKDTPTDQTKPHPILHSYLNYTFRRLAYEGKVMVNADVTFAAFNTGLVDSRFEVIYAIFTPNNQPQTPWQLAGFCIAGEGADGQNLVRHFNPLPPAAHYFDNPVELLYDVRNGSPELDWKHLIVDRFIRFPRDFLEDHCPSGFELKEHWKLSDDEQRQYSTDLGTAILSDTRTYRRIMNRLKDAVDLSIKRVSWNFKTAIPQYYPPVKRLQLLLPLCLVADDRVDLALAVESTPSGNYLGHTVLPLDWAYCNARLICRPDSDWLVPKEIANQSGMEEDTD